MAAIFEPNQDYCKDCPYQDYVFSGFKEDTHQEFLICEHESACSRMYDWAFEQMTEVD